MSVLNGKCPLRTNRIYVLTSIFGQRYLKSVMDLRDIIVHRIVDISEFRILFFRHANIWGSDSTQECVVFENHENTRPTTVSSVLGCFHLSSSYLLFVTFFITETTVYIPGEEVDMRPEDTNSRLSCPNATTLFKFSKVSLTKQYINRIPETVLFGVFITRHYFLYRLKGEFCKPAQRCLFLIRKRLPRCSFLSFSLNSIEAFYSSNLNCPTLNLNELELYILTSWISRNSNFADGRLQFSGIRGHCYWRWILTQI